MYIYRIPILNPYSTSIGRKCVVILFFYKYMNPLGSIFWVHFNFSKVDLVNDLSVIVLQITAKKKSVSIE